MSNSTNSTSSSDISNAASASTSTFVTALVFNAIVFGAELAVFTLVRPYFPAIYQPRTYAPPEDKRVKPLTEHIYDWPLAIFRADFRLVKDANGLDAYFYVRFLRMITRLLLPIWIISWIVLLPITAVGTSVAGRQGLDKFSFGNVSPSSQGRYAAHLILAYFSTVWVWWNIKREMHHFIIIRQQWLIDPVYASSAQASTVLIRGVPQRYLTEAALTKLFSCLPGGVAKVWLNRDLKEMPDLYDRRMKACAKLESAETNLINTAIKLRNKKLKAVAKAEKKKNGEKQPDAQSRTSDAYPLTARSASLINDSDTERNVSLAETLVPKGKRPTHRLKPFSWLPFSLPLIGKQVDTIEWARNEITETSEALKESRRTLAVDIAGSSTLPSSETSNGEDLKPAKDAQTYPPLNSAFVLFNKQIAAHLAEQALAHHDPYRMADRHLSIDPADVVWGNLNLNPYEARIRTAISWCMTLGLIILWAFPVAFVGVVSNIHALCLTYSWLAWICKLPNVVVGIISGILPPVLLAVLMMLLPIILRLLSRFEGTPTRTGIELSLMTRFFLFEVLHGFLIVTLASGIIAALPGLVSNPTSIPSMLAMQLPKASNFFLTYIILQGLSGTASGFLQVVPLVLYYVKLFILGSTPRSIYGIKYGLRNVSWGTLFPSTTLIVVITLAYSIISPIINGLACFSFFMFYQLWKYLFLWQLDQPKSGETGGLFFPQALQHVFVGLYIQQICLAALFFLAENENNKPSAVPEGALMIVLIAFTAFFHVIINNSYGPLSKALPLSLAEKTRGIDENQVAAKRDVEDKVAEVEGAEGHSNSNGAQSQVMTGTSLRQRNGSKESFPKGTTTSIDEAEREPPADVKEDVNEKEYARAREGSVVSGSSNESANNGKGKATSAEGPSTTPPSSIKAVDEDAGPKEFFHPASVEPQRIVWLPRDSLGLALEEVRDNEAAGILVSLEDAVMDDKGHVNISGPPPGGEVRTL